MARDPEKNKKSFLPKLVLICGFFILAAVSFFLVKEYYKKRQIQKEITGLEQEAAKINRDNLAIQEKIAYLQSRDFQEREAKDKLNLQSPDENVVVIKPGVAKEQKLETESENIPQPLPNSVPNPQKWWKYFFKY
ncbi:MAG: septum formation initiator family protein [Parcubacteria group bacterium]